MADTGREVRDHDLVWAGIGQARLLNAHRSRDRRQDGQPRQDGHCRPRISG